MLSKRINSSKHQQLSLTQFFRNLRALNIILELLPTETFGLQFDDVRKGASVTQPLWFLVDNPILFETEELKTSDEVDKFPGGYVNFI